MDMKLYTEEEVKNAIILGKMHLQKKTLFEILDMLTPIELPSDEDIQKETKDFKFEKNKEIFYNGAKWMKEQILNQNK